MKIAVFYENLYDAVQATGRSMEEVLSRLHDEGMELLYMTPDSWLRDRAALSGMMKKLGLGTEGMHAFCDFPADPDTNRYREVIDTAAEAGAGNLLIIPGMYSTGNTVRDLENMVTGVRCAVEYGRAKGVPVLMEDFDGPVSPYNSMAGLRYFTDSVKGLGCAFDTGNFAMFRENELEALELFADKIVTVHLKDRCSERRHAGDTPFRCADGKDVFACAIGSGDIRIAEILRRLKERNYSGNVIVELYAVDPRFVIEDAVSSLRWVRSQLGES